MTLNTAVDILMYGSGIAFITIWLFTAIISLIVVQLNEGWKKATIFVTSFWAVIAVQLAFLWLVIFIVGTLIKRM